MVSGAGGFIGSIVGGALMGGIGPAIGAALPSIADNAKVLVERLVPDANAREAAQAEVDAALAAMEVAKAQSRSIWPKRRAMTGSRLAGARPSAGSAPPASATSSCSRRS